MKLFLAYCGLILVDNMPRTPKHSIVGTKIRTLHLGPPKDKADYRKDYRKIYSDVANAILKKRNAFEKAETLGESLIVLGISRKEAKKIFMDYFTKCMGFEVKLAEINSESAMVHQYDEPKIHYLREGRLQK